MRLFYLHYEKMRYWLYQEEIFEELKAEPYFFDYTMEQCRQDLNALVGWKNLSTLQDTRNVKSIEAFKNKNFRYQMTEYSVEIERMVTRLENLFVERALADSRFAALSWDEILCAYFGGPLIGKKEQREKEVLWTEEAAILFGYGMESADFVSCRYFER